MKQGQREVTPEKRPARQWEKRGAAGERKQGPDGQPEGDGEEEEDPRV